MQLKEPQSPILTPLRMITVAILCISGLTFRFLWHRNAIAAAQATVSVAVDAGKAAVRANDFATGAKELDRVRERSIYSEERTKPQTRSGDSAKKRPYWQTWPRIR